MRATPGGHSGRAVQVREIEEAVRAAAAAREAAKMETREEPEKPLTINKNVRMRRAIILSILVAIFGFIQVLHITPFPSVMTPACLCLADLSF